MTTLIETLRHAFASRRSGPPVLPASLERLAREAVERRMETPAIIVLESAVPVAFLGGQVLAAVAPLVKLLGFDGDVDEIAAALEDRRTVRLLADRIEELAASAAAEGGR
jgi:hypothetical protein